MAFDPNTAQPVAPQPAKRGGFDPSTARPAPQTFAEQAEQENINPVQIMRDVAFGVGEPLLTMATGAAGELAGAITGAGTMMTPNPDGSERTEEAIRRQQAIQDAITYQPRTEEGRAGLSRLAESAPVQWMGDVANRVTEATGDAVYDLTGSPALAAVAKGAPGAIAEYAGAKIPRLASKVSRSFADDAARRADVQRGELVALESEQPNERGVTIAAEAIDTQRAPEVAEVAQFDPRIIQAAVDEGFAEVPPSIAAGNRQFRDVAQGLASIAGSEAKAQYGRFVEALADRADQIIREGGGDLDKPAVSARYKQEAQQVIDALDAEEDVIRADIRDKVGTSTPVQLDSLRQFVIEQAREFGGISSLPPEMKRIARLVLQPQDGKIVPRNPNYAEFDYLRRNIGQALRNKTGAFADAEEGQLKLIYGKMKEAQKEVAEQYDALPQLEAADALTIKRKAAEQSMVDLLGKNLSKDLMPQMAAKITGLPKGNVNKFNELVEGIPQNMRQEVVVSALNDLLRGTGADQKGMGAARFVGFMADLNRSPTAKTALYKHLPPQTQKSLDNLNILAEAVYKANKENITTGKIKQFMPDAQGFVRKLMGRGAGAAVGLSSGVPGGGAVGGAAVDAVTEFLSNQTTRAQRANEFLAGPSVQELIRRAVRDGVVEGNLASERTRNLEKVVRRSERFQRWADTLEGSEKAKLAALGLSGFLLYPSGEGEEETQPVATAPQPEPQIASR